MKGNQKRKKVKRGDKKRNKSEPLVIFSTNAAGLKTKVSSLKTQLNELKSAVFMVQETHFAKKGKLQILKSLKP